LRLVSVPMGQGAGSEGWRLGSDSGEPPRRSRARRQRRRGTSSRPGHGASKFVEGTDHTCRRTRPSHQPSYPWCAQPSTCTGRLRPDQRDSHAGMGREASRRLSRSRFPRGPGPSDHGRLRSRGAAGAPMLGALVARRVAGAPMLAALAGRELAVPRGRCGVWRSRGLGPSECDCNSGSEGPRPLVDDVRLGSRGAWAPRDRSG
jgi:hypothetical protein